jgi:hypothetical protein
MDDPPAEMGWDDAEKLFPGCSPQWDAQGGSEWLGDNTPVFVVHGQNFAIGYGVAPKAHWALWNNKSQRWLFVPRPVNLIMTSATMKLEAP